MGAQFFKGDLDAPARNEPKDDLLGREAGSGAKEGLRFEAAFRTADQDPANGQWGQATAIPEQHARDDLDRFLAASVPRDLQFLPTGLGIVQPSRQIGLKSALIVRCRFLSLALVFGPRAGMTIKGNAHNRWLQGTATRIARQIQQIPKGLLT